MSTPKDRLVALLQKYDPEKVPKADALLAKYVGKEEAFLKQLEKKYQSEAPAAGAVSSNKAAEEKSAAPAPPTPRATVAPGGGGTPKERLVALLQKHDPEKVPKADALLAKYVGKEEAFLKQLEKKYLGEGGGGAAAEGGSTTPREPAASPTQQKDAAPAPSTSVPATPRGTHKERLVALLQKHDPEKVAKADALLAKYVGKEEAFLTQLAKKYGEPTSGSTTPRSTAIVPPPASPTTNTPKEAAPTPPVVAAAATAAPLSHKDRLIALLKKHDPEKVAKADALLAKYAGKEDAFLSQLAKKYGEPADGGGASASVTPRNEPPAAPAPVVHEEKPLSHKDRLVAILKIHEPDKVSKADALLAKYVGKEEVFLKQLEKKYNVGGGSTTPRTPSSPNPSSVAPPSVQQQQQQQKEVTPIATAPLQHQNQNNNNNNNNNENDDEHENNQQHQQVQENAPSGQQSHGNSTPLGEGTPAGPSSNVSGTNTPRSTYGSNNNNNNAPQSSQQQQPQIVYQQSESDKRKLQKLASLRRVAAEQFLATKIEAVLRKNWFSVWRAAGQKKVAQRIMASTKSSALLPSESIDALAQLHMNPAAFTRIRFIREHLGLSIDAKQVPADAGSLARYVDETISASIEFVTVTYPEDLNRQQQSARAENQQLVGALQKAQEDGQERERNAATFADKLRYSELQLEDANKEIDGLHQQCEAQARLTARANNQVKKLQDSLVKEQRGIPSEVEQRIEQKDELASHLHKQLAATRASTNQWKDLCHQAQTQLQEERDRRMRAEQRVEVLSVALVPPETLGLTSSSSSGNMTSRSNHNNNNNNTGRSIAESVRNARENQQQQQYRDANAVQSPDQRRHMTYQEQSRLLAAARKALINEGSATGGDVPRLLGVENNNNNQQQSPRKRQNNYDDDEDNNNSAPPPPPPSSQPPADGTVHATVKNREGLNQTPAVEGSSNNHQDPVFSPSPSAQRGAANDDNNDDQSQQQQQTPFVNCPNCEVVQLTAFNGSRFSANPTDADKVAFCFSCRKTFSRIDLDRAEKNRIKSQNQQQRQQSVASSAGGGGTGQQQNSLSKSRVAANNKQEKIPASLRNNVAKLQAQRKL